MSGGQIPPLPPECMEVLKHVWDFLDDQMSEDATERLRAHIAGCEGCFQYATFQQNFLDALGAMRRRWGVKPELREKVLTALRDEGYAEK
ncbi:MAG TPA: zf-HC2 domain-containing protein [Gemmatimonadaceae bacterium]|nr:zf-HC2 domain-containing protein [Gemmatimonadaceae bacterium]